MQRLDACQQCTRLYAFRELQKQRYPDYHCKPVPAFGETDARLLIVGLAPGLHGANATGRPFTGDASGRTLFSTLVRFGFANMSQSLSTNDGMQLSNCRITNAVKCLPPGNKPQNSEINQCNAYLKQEISLIKPGGVILALGAIAHKAVLKASGLQLNRHPFAHLCESRLADKTHLIGSYHCSRYNINTKRLTQNMFDQVFERIQQILR
ncbi:MAG: uracil-DNA glycosylase [Pseudomonadota bacterium]